MLANLNGWHAAIIIAVILLLFGAPKIPMLARSLGQSMRIFKTEVRDQGAAAREEAEGSPTPAPEASGAVPPTSA